MRLIAHFYVWNAAQFVAWRLLQVHKYVDEIVVFDGAFQLLKDRGYASVPWSTDGTKQVVESLFLKCDLTYVRRETFWPDLVAARNFSLNHWKPDEWMYLMAADEPLVGNVEQGFNRVRQETTANVFYVPMRELRLKPPWIVDLGLKRRFFRWQQGLHWNKSHRDLRNQNNVHAEDWPRETKKTLKDLWILHLRELQFPDRIRAANTYRKFGK